jgi:hypothetical protein
MKLAAITLTKGIYIPGFGNVAKLENIEAEDHSGGILVTTSTAKVLIPWERIETVVTEWIPLPKAVTVARDAVRSGALGGLLPPPDAQEVASAQAHGAGMFASMDRGSQAPDPMGQQIAAGAFVQSESAANQAAQAANLQPPPPKPRRKSKQ